MRQRKALSSAVLGAWLLALLVGVVNACGWDDAFAPSHPVDVHRDAGRTGHDGPVSDCARLCAEGLPVVAKNQAVLATVGNPPVPVAASYVVGPSRASAQARRRPSAAHPPPAAPPLLRFLRLTL
jgi:hypothetical protein